LGKGDKKYMLLFPSSTPIKLLQQINLEDSSLPDTHRYFFSDLDTDPQSRLSMT